MKIKQLLFTAILLITVLLSAKAQCTLAVSSTTSGSASYNVSSLTISHTVSGSNKLLTVRAATTNGDPSTVTWNGSNLTKLATKNNGNQYTSIWYLINPASGTYNVVISGSNGFTPIAGVTSFTGAHQTSPFGTVVSGNFSSSSPSLTASSASGELVMDVVNSNFSCTVGSGQTQQYNIHEFIYYGSGSTESGASSVTMTWSVFYATGSHIAVPVKPCTSSPLTASAGSNQNLCTGSSVSIGGSPTASGGTSPYTYAWSPATGLSSTTTANPSANPTSSTTYTVTVTDAASTTKTSTVSVTVNALPTASAGSNQTICNGSSVAIGGSPTASGGTSPYTYAWSPATGLSSTTTANPTATPTSTTIYTVTVTDNNSCPKTSTVSVTVNSLPTASAGSNQSICNGSSIAIGGSPTASGGTSPYTYTWSPATGLSSTTTANPTANPTSSTTYTVTVTDNNSCPKTSTVSVTVNVLPTASAGSNQTICNGSSVAIGGSPTASGGTSPYTYAWSPATGLSSTTTANPTASPTSTTIYTVTVTDNNSCPKTSTVSVTVNATPTVSAGSDKTICTDSTTSIGGSPTASGGASPYTYSWNPSTGLNSTTIANPVANPASTTTYTVTVTDNNGCTALDAVIVTRETSPVTLTPNNNPVCQGTSITFTATPSGYGHYEFYKNGTNVQTGTSNTYTLSSPTNNDKILVTVLDSSKISIVNGNCVNISSTTTGSANSSATSLTISHTVSGSNTLLIVRVTSNGSHPTSVTWNGTNMTQSNAVYTNSQRASLWYIVNPASGTHNVVINGTAGFSPVAAVSSLTGVNQSNPIGATQGTTFTNSTPSLTISSNSTALVVDVANSSNSLSPSTGQTQQFNINANSVHSLGSSKPGASSVTTSWTGSSSTGAYIAASINAVSGCTGTPTTVYNGCPFGRSDTVTVTVNTLPTVTVTPAADTICIGSSTSLTAGGASTYTWIPSTGLSSTTGATVTANPTATTTYTVTGTSNGCTGTASVVITVNPLPTVSVSPTADTICVRDSTILTASGATTYAWSPATGLSATTGASVIAKPTATITYTVTGTNANGCTNTAIVTINVPCAIISINTTGLDSLFLPDTISYSISGAGLSGTYPVGGIVYFSPALPSAGNVSTITMAFAGGTSYEAMDVLVDLNDQGGLQNFRLGLAGGAGGYSSACAVGCAVSGLATGNLQITPCVVSNCYQAVQVYSVLKRKLDAGYYIVNNGQLKFKFDEEYNDTDDKLSFKIYNNMHNEVVNSVNLPSTLQLTSDYGERWFVLNIQNCSISSNGSLGGGYYILEVQNEKKEKWYLRFKHVVTIHPNCGGSGWSGGQ